MILCVICKLQLLASTSGILPYLECQLGAITEMNSFQAAAAGIIVLPPLGVLALTVSLVRFCQRVDGYIGDIVALDQAYPLELWQDSQAGDRLISQVGAAAQVNIPNTVAAVDQTLDSLVREIDAVAQVHVMQVLSKPRDGKDGLIGDVAAFGKYEVPETRGSVDNLLDGAVGDPGARREVKDAQVFEGPAGGE